MYILIFTGELAVLQAEIKLKTLTLFKPDLDNANVGSFIDISV